MADNEPVEAHPEVEPVLHDSNNAQEPQAQEVDATSAAQAPGDESMNAPGTQEPSEGTSAPEPPTAPNSEETNEGPVATAPDQAVNPGPPDDGAPSHSESQMPASVSAPEAAAPLVAPTPAKRFTSMNINKKFLAKAAGSPSSSNSPVAPKTSASASAVRPAAANPQPSSRLVTKKLTTITPAASASGGWSLRPTPPTSLSSSPAPADASAAGPPSSVRPSVSTDVRPGLVSSASALSVDSRSSAKASRDHSPVKAWATVPTSVGDIGRNLHDFPTAAEAAADSAETKRPAVSAAQTGHPATDSTAHGADSDARDSFRGMHLDPNAHHWDEMEDESNDFLGEVIDFGDGKTYTVPPEEDETASNQAFNKETRLGDDYDRSWPRSRPLPSEPETSQSSRIAQQHGLPPRQPSGDGRVLFNERSNRLEPARGPHSTSGGPFHQHASPYAHLPPRSAPRRNSALSSSDRPKMGHAREPPPHTRDPPPHAATDGRGRRPSDARSSHSPVSRRSSFLHEDDRARAGLASLRGRAGDEAGFGLRRETSRDSRISVGDRQPWGHALQHPSGHRPAVDPLHHASAPGHSAALVAPEVPLSEPADASIDKLRSPSQRMNPLPSVHQEVPSVGTSGTASSSIPPAVLGEEREKFMKQAAERARRRRQEEEAAREEARERAKKKAAELEKLSKASLVTASPLVALTRSAGAKSPVPKSPIPKSPIPKSPSVAPSSLPVGPDVPPKPNEAPGSSSAATTVSSWRTKPKPESNATSTIPKETPSQPALSAEAETVDQKPRTSVPPPPELEGLGGMQSIEELDKADGPVEVLDFSDMGKLAGRRTSITSPSDSHRRKRSVASDFLDEAPSTRRSSQAQANSWNRDMRPSNEHHEDLNRTGALPHKHTSGPNRHANENAWAKPSSSASGLNSRPGFKEAPISALDDVMLRIKGVLTDMHAEEKPAVSSTNVSLPNGNTSNGTAPAPSSSSAAPSKAAMGVSSRWMGTEVANWRGAANKKAPSGPPIEAQPTEPFAMTCPERPETPPPAWKAYVVQLGKSIAARPPMSKKQATLAKLPPMPVRWDILTWDPPVERMSTKTLSRDDMLFPKTYLRGVLSARVLLPGTEAQAKQNEASSQRPRLTATSDARPGRSSNISARPPPKSPAFMDTQWRKPQPTSSPLNNALELQNATLTVAPGQGNQLETTSRSPPPHHQSTNATANANGTVSVPPNSSKVPSKQNADVAFHRSLHEKRPSNPPAVSFTVSSELDDLSTAGTHSEKKVVSDAHPTSEGAGAPLLVVEIKGSEVLVQSEEEPNDERTISGDKATQSPTPNSSVLLTPPVKVTTPWQTSNSRLPDADYLKSVWQHASPKEAAATENSLRGLADDFPSSIPHSVQEMKAEDDEPKSDQPATSVPSRMPQHNAHRAFQQVPTSPAPMHMHGYPNHMPNQVVPPRPIPVTSFSLPPPAPPQVTTQPTPYSPYVHPTPPSLMYSMPPSRIAPSPAPGGQMWVQGQAYGRPSPPAAMYSAQQAHAMSYPSPVSQLPPPLVKQHGGINGNHGPHPLSSPAMSHAMHMGSPAMAHVAHMGSPALAHASPHMPGGPQHMYPGMGSPGGLGLGANMPYGAQRPTPQMMQQSPMQGPVANGYPMVPNGSYGPAGYGRGMRTPSDGMPHHMPPPHPQHAPVSPGAYHPNAYGRTW